MKKKEDKQDDEAKKNPMSGEKQKDFIEKAQKRLDAAIRADSHNREKAIEDLKFLNGEQWDVAEKNRRSLKKRPCLMVNLLPKYVNQLIGEQRQNRPKIKVRPVDSKADVQIAKIREGLISNIEYLSRAETIYDMAYASAVRCGYGAYRILTRYTDDNPFEQEIYLELMPNAMTQYGDPAAKDPIGSDAMWWFIISKMARKDFEDEYPEATVPSDETITKAQGITYENWWDKDNVTIAEYFTRKMKKEKICQLSDGRVMPEDDAKKEVQKAKDERGEKIKAIMATVQPPQQPPQMPGQPPAPPLAPQVPPQVTQMLQAAELKIEKTRDSEQYEVKRYVITAAEVLEEKDIAGQYIPVVPVYGREINIEGKRYIEGLIRNAKDSQRMYNYWYTSAAETIALAPKSPWVGTAKMFEGYEADYASSNVDNIPFLKYKNDPASPGMKPERQPPAQPPAALFAALERAQSDMMSSLGMFQRDLGMQGREVSGSAIKQARQPGETSTVEFYDNLVRSINHGGRIINDMLPFIYDTERDVRLRNADDTETFVPVNTTAGDALTKMNSNPTKYQGIDRDKLKQQIDKKGMNAKYNDITAGKYGTIVATGPTHATQRQEAAENFLQLLQTPLGNVIEKVAPDIVIKNMDILDADEMAQRLRKMLPPGIYEPKAGEKPLPKMPPNPQALLIQAKMKNEDARQQVAKIKAQVELVKLYKESKETDTQIRKEILSMLMQLHAPDEQQQAPPMQGRPMMPQGVQR